MMKNKDKKSRFQNSRFVKNELPVYLFVIIVTPVAFFVLSFFIKEDGVPLIKNMFAPKFDEALLSVCVSNTNMEMAENLEKSLPSPAKILVITTEIYDATEKGVIFTNWQAALPGERIPKNSDEVDVIICVDKGEIFLEMCSYSGNKSISRTKYRPEITAVDRETGKAFATTYLQGSPPEAEECPWALVNDSLYKGKMPTPGFLSWIEETIP